MAKQLIETIGQFMDAVLKDRKATVTVSGGSQLAHLRGLVRRCYKHYGAFPRDGALLRGIDAVAEHRGCFVSGVRAMTLAEFNSALDEAVNSATPKDGLLYGGKGLFTRGQDAIRLAGQEECVMEALVKLRAASKCDLVRKSGVEDAVKVLKRVKGKYPMLADKIILPLKGNAGGYRLLLDSPG